MCSARRKPLKVTREANKMPLEMPKTLPDVATPSLFYFRLQRPTYYHFTPL
jgi:hypothetical protein